MICDSVSYPVLQTSFVTLDQIKAYKYLEAYNQYVCGWVKDVFTKVVAGKCIYVVSGSVSLVAPSLRGSKSRRLARAVCSISLLYAL